MATAATSSLPLALSLAIARIDQILRSSQLLYAGGRFKEMRGDRLEAIGVLLVTMLRHCCIQNDGHIVLLINNGKEAVPITIKQLASLSGLGVKRVVRCLHELREAGFLSSRPQFRRNSKGSCRMFSVFYAQILVNDGPLGRLCLLRALRPETAGNSTACAGVSNRA